MTALQIAVGRHPQASPYMIIKYGCPDRYGVGIKPESCKRNTEEFTDIRQCCNCWNQEYKGETECRK